MSSIGITGAPLTGKKPAGGGWSVTEVINKGWTANLRFGQWINLRGSSSAIELTISDDFGNTLTTPEYLHNGPGRGHGKSRPTDVELVDAVSWMLSSGSESLPTQIGGTMADICGSIEALWAVSIGNKPSLPIFKEDVKDTTGWNPLLRMARVNGSVLEVTPSNILTFRDSLTWNRGAVSGWKPNEGGVKEIWRPLDRFDKVKVTKNLGTGTNLGPWYFDFTTAGYATSQALPVPLNYGAAVDNVGGLGYCGWVILFDADGLKLAHYPLVGKPEDVVTDPNVGTWPATHFSCIVYPDGPGAPVNCRLRISGSPFETLPDGIEGSINETYGSGRGLPSSFSDSMIPDKAHADATWPAWLQEANRGTNGFTATGPLCVAIRCGHTFSWEPLELAGRIEQVAHSHSGTKGQTTITVNCDFAA